MTKKKNMLLTFLTLCGFLSLRHLRMSISVVLTQPGCGRRQETECVCGSDNSVSPACMICARPHTIRCCCFIQQCHAHTRLICKETKSDSASHNKSALSAEQCVALHLLFSRFKYKICLTRYQTFFSFSFWFISIFTLLHHLTLLFFLLFPDFGSDSPPADGRPRMPSPGCPESSSLPCPSFCRSCQQRKQATHAESTCL